MTMTQSSNMAVDSTEPQGLVVPKGVFLSSSKLKIFGCIAACIFVFLLTIADAEHTNPCRETQYWIENADGSSLCEDCPSCLPGQGLSEECGKRINPSAMVTCQPCQPRVSFSSQHDTSMCTPCSSCAEDQVVSRNCSPEWDVECAKRCSSKDRYYNDDKGECLPCLKCCGDDQDVVENECKGKLGAGSNMICSFDSSINRCDKATKSPHKLTAITKQVAATHNNYTSPSQGLKSVPSLPPTTQNSHHLSQRQDQDFWTAVSISVVIMVLLVALGCVCGCCWFYLYKKRQVNTSFWCCGEDERGNSVTGVQYSLDKKAHEDGAKEASAKIDRFYRIETLSPELKEPLLKQGDPEILTCSCEMDTKEDGAPEKLANLDAPCRLETMSQELTETLPTEGDSGILTRTSEMATKKDSKPLSSLLEKESDLQKICERLDTSMPAVGHYRAVALYYGSNHYQIVSVFEKHSGGPSRALIEWLAAEQTKITVEEFASVVGKEAKRNDVVELLEAYDLKLHV